VPEPCDSFFGQKKKHCEFPANSLGAQFMSPQRSSSAAHYYHVSFFFCINFISSFFVCRRSVPLLLRRAFVTNFFVSFFVIFAAKKDKKINNFFVHFVYVAASLASCVSPLWGSFLFFSFLSPQRVVTNVFVCCSNSFLFVFARV